jgi:hypothetical protein
MASIDIPTFNIPNVNDITVDICNQSSQLINNNIIPTLNSSVKKNINRLNISSMDINAGILNSTRVFDDVVQISVEGINTSIDAINNSTKKINKVLSFLQTLIKTNTFFDTLKTIISLSILSNIPPDKISEVTNYTNYVIYFIFFSIFVSPILSIIFLFL